MADVPGAGVVDVAAALPAADVSAVPAVGIPVASVMDGATTMAPPDVGAVAPAPAPEAAAPPPVAHPDAMVTHLATEVPAAAPAPAPAPAPPPPPSVGVPVEAAVPPSAAPAVDAAAAEAAAVAAATAAANQATVNESAPDEAAAAAAAVVAAAEPLPDVAAEAAAAAAAAAAPAALAAAEAAAVPAAVEAAPPVPAAVPMEGDTAAAEAAAAAAAASVAAAAAASAMEDVTPARPLDVAGPAGVLTAAAAPAAPAAAVDPAAATGVAPAVAPVATAPVAAVPAAAAPPAVAPVESQVVMTPARNSRDNPVDITQRTRPPSILPGVVTPGGGGRRTPRVISEHFCDVAVDGTGGSARLSAVCLHCGCTIRGSVAVTSNFIKHMERRHQAAHAAFLEAGGVKTKRVRRSSGASPGEAKKSRGRPPSGEAAKAAAVERAARASLGGGSSFGAGDTMNDDGTGMDMDTGMGYPAPSMSATHVNVLGMDTVLPSVTCSRVRGVLSKQTAPLVLAHGVAAAVGAHSVALKCDGALPGGRFQFRALVSLFVSAAASAAALADAASGGVGYDGLSPSPVSPHTPSATAAGSPLVPRGAGRKPVTVFAGATLGAEAAAAAAALRLPCTVVLPTVVETDADRGGDTGDAPKTTVVDAKTTRLAQVRAAGATILFRGLNDDAADAAADVLASASATPAVLADLSLPVSMAGQMNLMGDREKHLVGGYATAILEALTEGAGGEDADVDVVYVPARVACVVAAASVIRAVLPKANLVAVEVVAEKPGDGTTAGNGSVYAYPIDEEEAAADPMRTATEGGVSGGRGERFGPLSTVEREFVDSLVSRIIRVSPSQAVAAATVVASAGRGACADPPGAVALAGVLTDDPLYVRAQRVLAWITSAADFTGSFSTSESAAAAASTAATRARSGSPTSSSSATLAISVDGADQPSVLSQLLHRLRACGTVTSFRFARSSAILTTLVPSAAVPVEGADGVLERLRRYGYVTADVSSSRLISHEVGPATPTEGGGGTMASGIVDGFIGALPLASPGEVVCLYRFEREAGGGSTPGAGNSVQLLEEVLGEMRVGWKVVLAGGWGTSGALVGFVVLSTELEVVSQWATEHGRGGVDESDNPASAVLRGSG
ncbi:hypothetical protein MMPV_004417 [Pyropia vietnamensis]